MYYYTIQLYQNKAYISALDPWLMNPPLAKKLYPPLERFTFLNVHISKRFTFQNFRFFKGSVLLKIPFFKRPIVLKVYIFDGFIFLKGTRIEKVYFSEGEYFLSFRNFHQELPGSLIKIWCDMNTDIRLAKLINNSSRL